MVPGMTEMGWRDNVRPDKRRLVKETKDGTRRRSSRSQRRTVIAGVRGRGVKRARAEQQEKGSVRKSMNEVYVKCTTVTIIATRLYRVV